MLLVSDGSLRLVRAELRYRCIDPLAVQLRLSVGRLEAVSWTFSRDLLIPESATPAVSATSGYTQVEMAC